MTVDVKALYEAVCDLLDAAPKYPPVHLVSSRVPVETRDVETAQKRAADAWWAVAVDHVMVLLNVYGFAEDPGVPNPLKYTSEREWVEAVRAFIGAKVFCAENVGMDFV